MRFLLTSFLLATLFCRTAAGAVTIYTQNGNTGAPVRAVVDYRDQLTQLTGSVNTNNNGMATVNLTVGDYYNFLVLGISGEGGFLDDVFVAARDGIIVIYVY